MKIHMSRKHKNIVQIDGIDDNESETEFGDMIDSKISVETQTELKCKICDYVAGSNSVLNNHFLSYHKKYNCLECDYGSDYRSSMRQHMKKCNSEF